jgi:hypothetical protein
LASADFEFFMRQGLDASAQAVAVAGEDRAEETLRFIDGRSIFVPGRRGWRAGRRRRARSTGPIRR